MTDRSFLQSIRGRIRHRFFETLRRACLADDGRRALVDGLSGLALNRPCDIPADACEALPYHELGRSRVAGLTSQRDDIVLVTARFRSGSTLLWNIFRNVPGCTAYYEPFNERRWFNRTMRGDRVDSTHRKVDDYWREFDGLDELDSLYDDAWNEREFYMSEEAWNPRMRQYMESLIDHAAGRPVLQFNRADFRLPWMRRTFPNARIIHIYRHPRDQWCSVLQKPDRFPTDGRMDEFASVDGFYLRRWASDLKYHFPFLDEAGIEHPYQLHYFLWKLSFVYGRTFSDLSFSFEELTTAPEQTLVELCLTCGIDLDHVACLVPLIEPPPFGKWRAYADDDWFVKHEEYCETVLAEFFRGAAIEECSRGSQKDPAGVKSSSPDCYR